MAQPNEADEEHNTPPSERKALSFINAESQSKKSKAASNSAGISFKEMKKKMKQ